MGGKRSNWGPHGDAIFADGIRRGLTGEEISSAMRGAGVKGASPATVKRRMLEQKGSTRLSKHAARHALAHVSVAPPSGATPPPQASTLATEYAFEGDAPAVVAVAQARLAAILGRAPDVSVLGENARFDHYDAILATASPSSLAYLALFVTDDERTSRDEGEDDDEHAGFLEAHEAAHLARARKLLRDAIAAISGAHASSFTVRTKEKAS